jgi:L,D-peptidoglycan transpeptidase YkuD (ErfK/YbiS/YcfS/YnhG family)
MKTLDIWLMMGFLLLGPSPGVGQELGDLSVEAPGLVAGARQHLVVVTAAPQAISGYLYRMERVEGAWRQAGSPVRVVVGRSGIGPKHEGDGRSPQGIFPLTRSFGYAAEPPPGTALAYEPQAPGAVCVDDSTSGNYNRVFDADTLSAPKDWASAENMRRDLAHGDDLYRWGIIVGYNRTGMPGAGSCIFLHIWRGPGNPTAGCTAMAEADLLNLLSWLEPENDPAGGPLLIQGTRTFLEGLRQDGILPYPVPDGGSGSAAGPSAEERRLRIS